MAEKLAKHDRIEASSRLLTVKDLSVQGARNWNLSVFLVLHLKIQSKKKKTVNS